MDNERGGRVRRRAYLDSSCLVSSAIVFIYCHGGQLRSKRRSVAKSKSHRLFREGMRRHILGNSITATT